MASGKHLELLAMIYTLFTPAGRHNVVFGGSSVASL